MLFISVYSFAQDTIDSTKSENKKLEKLVEAFRFNKNGVVMYIAPSFGYDPNSSWEFGFVPLLSIAPKSDTLQYYRSSKYSGFYSYSTQNWINLKTEVDLYRMRNIHSYFRLQYVQMPQNIFSLTGGNADKVGTYFIKSFSTNITTSYIIREAFSIGVNVLYEYSDIDNVQWIAPNDFLQSEKNNFLAPSISLLYDTRDFNNYPQRGYYLNYDIGLTYNSTSSNTALYISFDLRKYFTFLEKNTVAIQVSGQKSNDDELPYYSEFKIGGKNRLRGFDDNNAYKGTQVYYAQIEYRRMLWWRFGCALFAGGGTVYKQNYNEVYSYGAGIRFVGSEKDKLNFRIDYGRSNKNTSAVFFTVGEAF